MTKWHIIWHYRDLRIEDNPALSAAASLENVLPLYVHCPKEEGSWSCGEASNWWLHHSLQELSNQYSKLGSRLIIRTGPSIEVFEKLASEISIGAGQTEMCIYTIPAGKTGYFLGGYAAMSRVGNNSAVFTSKIRVFGGVFRTVSRISCIGAGASSWQYRYPVGQSLPEKTDILLRCEEVDANGTGVSGGFTILLKDN